MIATASSLAPIVPTTISSLRSPHAKGNIVLSFFNSWFPFIFVMAVICSFLAHSIRGNSLVLIFECIVIFVIFNMLFRAVAPYLVSKLPCKFGQ
ncbi:TSUP family transporter, partial [Pseudoalteromonas sp. S2893]|uniref:TSUP family transporter n=1 Tax=Pseudoalteromonas sp. S2893 TaxID=579530 RepID=UPI0020168B11